MCRRFFHV
jgi:hypothetical protein